MRVRILRAVALLLLLCGLLLCPSAAGEAPLTVEASEWVVIANGARDNDACFDGYVRALFGLPTSEEAVVPKRMPVRLSDGDRLSYDYLAQEIVSIAAGERDSTAIDIPLSNLGLNGVRFSAADLGVSAVVEDGKITSEASKALLSKLAPIKTVIRLLMVNYPYELYWFDKSAYKIASPIAARTIDGEYKVYFSTENMVVKMIVSQDYAAEELKVDTGKVQRAKDAARRAGEIVASCAGLLNYEKLKAYKEKICELVDYDRSASDSSTGTHYGDPWQLVSVFDGDSATNVVCEGYSKAFQYLCDLSEFDGDVNCFTVTGTMNNGLHMWNVIHMENGRNYMADITNCEPGMVGATERLFLRTYLSGSASTGYRFQLSSTLNYIYHNDTLALHDIEELTLSDKNYVDEYDPVPDPDPDPGETFTLCLPGSLLTVEASAFEGITAQVVVIPEGCTSIDERAFADCPGLVEIDIPGTVTDIHDEAFAGCGELDIVSDSQWVREWAEAHGFNAVVPEGT